MFLIPQEVVERLEINNTMTVAWCVWWRSDRASPSSCRGERRRRGAARERRGPAARHLGEEPKGAAPLPLPLLI